MTVTSPPDLSAAVACHRCGYDVRAQPADGECPECRASVAESHRLALIPIRPRWRDSDPRWRRRMLAGVWVLVFLPLMSVLQSFGWAAMLPAVRFLHLQAGQMFDDCFVSHVYAHLVFSVGVVLFFAKERGRRVARIDQTRKWGIAGSYGVLLLGSLGMAFITALVMLGIAASLINIPPKFQTISPNLFIQLGGYMRYGPNPGRVADAALVACSSAVILLGCVSIFDALRSSGSKVLAALLLAPLGIAAVVQIVGAGLYALDVPAIDPQWIYNRHFFFNPDLLANVVATVVTTANGSVVSVAFWLEASKWLACFAIAIWLTVAQLAAVVRRKPSFSRE